MDKEQALSKVGLFEHLNPKFIKGIAGICTERTFKPGEYLMRQGEDGIGLIIILSGKVRIEKNNASGASVELAENGPGDIMTRAWAESSSDIEESSSLEEAFR